MLTISKESNPNYLAKIFEVKSLSPIKGADRIQTLSVDFQDVVVSKDVKEGDKYIYFPVECKINKGFLSETNSFRKPELNIDQEQKGFFEDNCRVKAVRLMKGQVKSMGYAVPAKTVIEWSGLNYDLSDIDMFIGTEFDTINGKLLVEKYQIPVKESQVRQGKKPQLSRLIDGQVHLHKDTEQLRKNAHKINPNDVISITYKTHGTSWWVSNVLTKKRLSVGARVAKFLGVNVVDTEYDLIYGSRKVVKNKAMKDPKGQDHFFGYDLWEDIKNEVGEHIPKGYTLYGEMLGYDKNGKAIQKGFDYGCAAVKSSHREGYESEYKPQSKLEIYRITNTTPDGLVTELSYPEIVEFCERAGLTASHLMYYGRAGDYISIKRKMRELSFEQGNNTPIDVDNWNDRFVTDLEEEYNEKDCFMCTNPVPEEGVVVRKEKLFDFEAYKLKSFRFLEWETKSLDKGESDIESEN